MEDYPVSTQTSRTCDRDCGPMTSAISQETLKVDRQGNSRRRRAVVSYISNHNTQVVEALASNVEIKIRGQQFGVEPVSCSNLHATQRGGPAAALHGGCQSRDAKPWWSSVCSLGPGNATAHARLGLCVAVPT